jgi:hypothetical protein
LRNIFVFEKDNLFLYERTFTKVINLQVRNNILKELYFTRRYKILPFEVLPKQFTEEFKNKM